MLVLMVIEETDYSDKVIEAYQNDKELTEFLNKNYIGLHVLTYSNEKVCNTGELRPGIPHWFFYDENEVIKRKLIGRFSPEDIIKELKEFYKLK